MQDLVAPEPSYIYQIGLPIFLLERECANLSSNLFKDGDAATEQGGKSDEGTVDNVCVRNVIQL